MRRPLILVTSSTLALALAAPSPALASTQMRHRADAPAEAAGAAEAPAEDPKDKAASEAAEAAKTAFRLNDYAGAVEKFREAYAANGDPTYLFNIAISYERWGENKRDIQAFRNAVSAYKNFRGEEIRAVRKDGATEEEIADIKKQLDDKIAKIEEKIAALEAEEKAAAEAEREQAALLAAQQQNQANDVDPGEALRKKSKLWMGIGAGGGGVLAAAGIGISVAFALQGSNATDQLSTTAQNYLNGACGQPNQAASNCDELWSEMDTLKADGNRANRLSLVVGIPVAAVGVALLGTGVALSLKYKKQANAKSSEWREERAVSIMPTNRGVVLSGRF